MGELSSRASDDDRDRRGAARITAALFAHVIRRGRIRLPRHANVVSGFADVDLDLRGEEITSDRTSITVLILFGNGDIYVPEGMEVDVAGLTVFGHRRGVATRRSPRRPSCACTWRASSAPSRSGGCGAS